MKEKQFKNYFQKGKPMIPLKDCKKGYVYELSSRNLLVGLFDGDAGFIGIRKKFGNLYLFTEYHWDTGPPFGTVQPLKQIYFFRDTFDENKDYDEIFTFLKPFDELVYKQREKEYLKWRQKYKERQKNETSNKRNP